MHVYKIHVHISQHFGTQLQGSAYSYIVHLIEGNIFFIKDKKMKNVLLAYALHS